LPTPIKTPKEPLKVIIDSNALFVPLQFKIDMVSELERLLNRRFELVILSPVQRRLNISGRRSEERARWLVTL
jgi:rRNA-processing protein FCF1